ncbi:MAG: hypothetical protein JEZ05_00560 [Tenericutes bacterium]|nr:hypothetical protein [Mycoplasmatota bacterium]
MNWKKNWLFFIILILMLSANIYFIIQAFKNDFEASDIISIISISLAAFTLIMSSVFNIKKIEQTYELKFKQMNQDSINSLVERKANILTKYRMDWLRNLKTNTNIFEINILSLLNIPNYNFKNNVKLASESLESINAFISFLKNELNILNIIELDIIKKYEDMAGYLNKVTELKNYSKDGYYYKCSEAYKLKFLDSDTFNVVKNYYDEISKYTLSSQDKLIFGSTQSEYNEKMVEKIYLDYELDLPFVTDVENDLFSYYLQKSKIIMDKVSMHLRLYFKTEWERIKHEIGQAKEINFNFEETYNKFIDIYKKKTE